MHPADISAALKRAGFGQAELGRLLDVSKSTVNLVINGKGRSEKVESKISELTGLPLDVLWPQHHGPAPDAPGAEVTALVDPNRLAFIGAYIEAYARDRLGAAGVANVRVVGQIYNEVRAKGFAEEKDQALANERIELFVEQLASIDGVEAPEELAKRLLRGAQRSGEIGGNLQVSGDRNVVAGRDQVGIRESAPSYGAKLTIAEERWLRLLRALEPAQQEEVEKFMRQKIAGG